jgi:hypothetical protein
MTLRFPLGIAAEREAFFSKREFSTNREARQTLPVALRETAAAHSLILLPAFRRIEV